MGEDYGRYLEVAKRAAWRAGPALLSFYGKVDAREKGPGDLVTDADSASQRVITFILNGQFPDHTILAEEDGVVPDPEKPWRWVIDPLDGTINFAHGFPLWCISIALEHRGELVAGVIHVPLNLGTFAATAGGGATLDDKPLKVSEARTLRTCLIATGMPTDFAGDADRQTAYHRRFSTGTHSVRRTGSSAWNLAIVASGGCDAFYATSLHPWDAAAGVLLVREAGGIVTDLHGGAYDLYGGGILATNGHVHDECLRALAEAWPAP